MILYHVFTNHLCVFDKLFCRCYSILLIVFTFVLLLSNSFFTYAADGVTFTDIATNRDTGISYRRIGFRNDTFLDSKTIFSVGEAFSGAVRTTPMFNDIPGVAILDFDRDGDLDLYVSNYQTGANSLYENQLNETGKVTFVDVGVDAGVDATDQDSTGVCFGDIDNDDDEDLLVLGGISSNRLFENLGNSRFVEITSKLQTGMHNVIASSCSIGDVNADGLLDLLVANSFQYEFDSQSGQLITTPGHNQLFLNQGKNNFVDVSVASGIQNIANITWAIALVDYDQDGDVDIVTSDDFRGFTRIYKNDGNGFFTDVTVEAGTNRPGWWMGLAFGDLNRDGNMDIFNSNVGDYFDMAFYAVLAPDTIIEPGSRSSGWFLGQDDGTFIYPGTGALGTTPFGWGATMADYDNDGDTDIIYHGGMNVGAYADATNPGAVLQNDGMANFNRDSHALANSTNHTRRAVRGVAAGDLNDDGFMDLVSVSSTDWPSEFPLAPILPELRGGQFDTVAYKWPEFTQYDPTDASQGFTWNGYDPVDGTLSVEINSANNGNNWVKVKLLGGIGLTSNGRVNRDGIGAVVTFTPKSGKPVMRPVIGGASHASADSLEASFGLNSGNKGTVHVLWPGGVRNKLYKARAEERIVFPEIPCGYDDVSLSRKMYTSCVKQALNEFVDAGILNKKEHERFMSSAKKAYAEHRNNDDDGDDD